MINTMNSQYAQRRPQHGYTIVEILVALTISLILLLGVVHIFQGSRTSYDTQTGVARLQENARFALDVMARSISMAGAMLEWVNIYSRI